MGINDKNEIDIMLAEIYLSIGIDAPSNHNEILDFCYEDVKETADHENWHEGDVAIAFRRFIETKSK